MDFINEIFRNQALVTAAVSWIIAAVLKVLIIAVTQRKLDWERMLGTGGMPSTHTTPVIACTTSIGLVTGFDGPIFAVAFVLSIIVAYDATGIRRHAGDQAKAITMLIEDLSKGDMFKGQKPADFFKRWNLEELQTLIGHNPFEVFVGVLLGILVALVIHIQFGYLFL